MKALGKIALGGVLLFTAACGEEEKKKPAPSVATQSNDAKTSEGTDGPVSTTKKAKPGAETVSFSADGSPFVFGPWAYDMTLAEFREWDTENLLVEDGEGTSSYRYYMWKSIRIGIDNDNDKLAIINLDRDSSADVRGLEPKVEHPILQFYFAQYSDVVNDKYDDYDISGIDFRYEEGDRKGLMDFRCGSILSSGADQTCDSAGIQWFY